MYNVWDILPPDIVWKIFSTLSIKYLLKFKCVSKSCCMVIEDPEFIKRHVKKLELDDSNMKLIAHGFADGYEKLYDVDFDFSESFQLKSMEEIDYTTVTNKLSKQITLAGSCNGLVCVVYSAQDAIIGLWNPTTRKQIQLPICPEQYDPSKHNGTYLHGFGYDEVSDDYKVVRCCLGYENSEVYVYSLKSNGWKRLGDFAFKNDIVWQYVGVFANGALHWLLKDHYVLTFNFATEEFKRLPPPEASTKDVLLCVTFVGGRRHLIFLKYDGPREIWEMTTYETKDCWTKLTLDFSNLMDVARCNYVMIYDVKGKALKELKFPDKAFDVKSCLYFRSLVPLGAAGGRSAGITEGSRKKTFIMKDHSIRTLKRKQD